MKISDNITAIILAGGNGTRLQTIVNDRQKVVAEINNRPFLTILLSQLEQFGIHKAVLCTGYMAETVETVVNKYDGSIDVQCSYEEVPLGTGGAVQNALPLVNTDYFMLLNGDSFLDLKAEKFLHNFIASGSNAVMALTKVCDVSRYGAVILNEDGQINSFCEKSKYSGSGLINAGISLINKQLFKNHCPDKLNFSIETAVFPSLIVANKLHGFVEYGNFIDIGIPETYNKAAQLLKLAINL